VKFLSDGVAPSGGTLNYSAFNTGLFNPYLIVGQDRGKEIHLADRIPTSKMNLTYFGQYQDRTNPSSGKYFKTADNLPWAINVDSSIPFATEKTDISEAHLKFIDWATSGGTSSTNWFLNQDGNRNNTKLMNR
jgi:LruC domain-containing protein